MSIDAATAQTWATSQSGLAYEIMRTQRLAGALGDPADYMRQRLGRLRDISTNIDRDFVDKFNALRASGMPPEDAKRRAEDYVAKLKQIQIDELNFDFPSEISNLAANLEYKRGQAGRSGLDVANIAKGSGSSRTRKPRKSKK